MLLISALKVRPGDLGASDGEKDAVAVEVLNAAVFDERYPALIADKPGPPPVSPAAATKPAAPATPPAPQPAAGSAAAVPPAAPEAFEALTLPLRTGTTPPPLDLAVSKSYLAALPKQRPMTAAEFVARQLSGSARQRIGEIDEYERMIARELEQSKPVSNGVTGQLVVAFAVSQRGELQDLHMLRSSGKAPLDRLVLASLTGLRFKPPPAGAELRDRSFEITYDYK